MLNLKNLFKPKSDGSNILALDFSTDNLKLAFLNNSGVKKEISTILNRDIRGATDQEIARIIRSFYANPEFRGSSVVDLLPSPAVITKNIEVPSKDPQEVEEMVNLQASRFTPYAREDIIFDYLSIGVYKRSYTKLLLVTASRTLIKRHLDILNQAGIHCERIFFSPESIASFAIGAAKVSMEGQVSAVIHIDAGFSDFMVAVKDKSVFVRGIPIGADHFIQDKAQYQARFIEEAKTSLEAYSAEDIERPPQLLILCGVSETAKELKSLLSENLRLPTEVISYLDYLPVKVDALTKGAALKTISFLNVTAPLISAIPNKINLVPEEIKFRKILEEKGKDAINTGALVTAFCMILFAIVASNIYFKRTQLKKILFQYEAKHKLAQGLETDFNKIQQVRSVLNRRGFSLAVINELYEILPDNIRIEDIRFDLIQDRFSLRGSAETRNAHSTFLEALNKSDYFKDVNNKYATKRSEGDKDVIDFEIVSNLRK